MSQPILMLLALFLTSCSVKQDIPKTIKRKPISISMQDSVLAKYALAKATDIVLLLLPLSGDNEKIGKGVLNSCIIAAEESSDTTTEFCVIDTEDRTLNKNLLFSKFKNTNLKAIIGPIFYTEIKKFGALFPRIPIFTLSNNLNANNNHVFACGLSPQDEIKKLFSYAKTKKLDTFLIMLPNSQIGNDILKCIKNILKVSNIEDSGDMYEIIRYNRISKKEATKYANNSGKKVVFVIEPILNIDNLIDIQVFTLSAQVLSDLDIWSGSIFAFAGNQKLENFIRDYRNTFNISPNILDIIGYDVTKAVLEMIIETRNPHEDNVLDTTKEEYDGCLGEFSFIKNKGLKRKLELFQSE